ncbi:hypothetical protein GALMADRAFT_230663 [Galerina marginata CBS 339.88]|uniref:DUF6533 domain-containing protein n=1 Tax=Galerina marginata (strain CBS 339.88) TaxID=685588 RepID=A0A067SP54_GALM3|nr:hypothetical protein GALMADRAFT_230663 [Galerina marginata CBS 339.88]
MTTPPPSTDLLLQGISQTQITSYVWVSGLTVLIYDTIATLPREVTYIWRQRWSLPTTLYLALRYWGLIMIIGSNPFLLNIVNGILGLRLYALYGRDPHVLSFLCLLFSAEVQIYIGVKIGISTVSAAFVPPKGVHMLGCLTATPDFSGITTMWIVSIIVAVICFIMTLAQFIHSAREARRTAGRYSISPLAVAFVKDGTVYFLAWMAITLIVAGSRLVLNLREAAVHDISNTMISSYIRGLENTSSNGIEFHSS